MCAVLKRVSEQFRASVLGNFERYCERMAKNGAYVDHVGFLVLETEFPCLSTITLLSANKGTLIYHDFHCSGTAPISKALAGGVTVPKCARRRTSAQFLFALSPAGQ